MEDVYTTGLLARACNIVRYHHPGFDTMRKYASYRLKVLNILAFIPIFEFGSVMFTEAFS